MVAKHFENSEWGFLNKNEKRRKKGRNYQVLKCFTKEFYREKTWTLFLWKFCQHLQKSNPLRG